MQNLKEEKSITISFTKGLQGINLPLLKTEKNGYALYFLIDTGANKNYIRQDILNLPELNEDTIILDETEEYHGIDNVCHEAKTCNFRFDVENHKYMEKYQIIKDGSALTFQTAGNSRFHIAGILGTPFLAKHKAVMNFETSSMTFIAHI